MFLSPIFPIVRNWALFTMIIKTIPPKDVMTQSKRRKAVFYKCSKATLGALCSNNNQNIVLIRYSLTRLEHPTSLMALCKQSNCFILSLNMFWKSLPMTAKNTLSRTVSAPFAPPSLSNRAKDASPFWIKLAFFEAFSTTIPVTRLMPPKNVYLSSLSVMSGFKRICLAATFTVLRV